MQKQMNRYEMLESYANATRKAKTVQMLHGFVTHIAGDIICFAKPYVESEPIVLTDRNGDEITWLEICDLKESDLTGHGLIVIHLGIPANYVEHPDHKVTCTYSLQYDANDEKQYCVVFQPRV